MTAVIIDDVANARAALKQDLADYCPEIELLGEAEGVVSGAKLIREAKPELVFLDIQMQDGTGFDLLEILGDSPGKIIFTTSSDEFAIRAFKFSAVDYLLKPVDPEELQAAVKKADAQTNDGLELLKQNINGRPQKLALNSQDKIQVVDVSDIVRCESNGSYTLFFLRSKEEVLVTKTLKEFDQMLTPMGFIRAHQTHLVNLDFVKEFVKTDGGYLNLKNGENVPVASRKKSLVLKVLSELGGRK